MDKVTFSYIQSEIIHQVTIDGTDRAWEDFLQSNKQFARGGDSLAVLVRELEKTNRACSSLFAIFIPIRTTVLEDALKDLLLPLTLVRVPQLKLPFALKIINLVGSLLIDLVILPFRCVAFIPRCQYNKHKIGLDGINRAIWEKYSLQSPCLVTLNPGIPSTYQCGERSFVYSQTPIPEILIESNLRTKSLKKDHESSIF